MEMANRMKKSLIVVRMLLIVCLVGCIEAMYAQNNPYKILGSGIYLLGMTATENEVVYPPSERIGSYLLEMTTIEN